METTRRGEPTSHFWTTLRALIHERSVAIEMVLRRPESVATLRRQKVSDFQIANQIYGHRGEGPFLEEGRIRFDLLDKEEKDPGSVVPADWVHPTERERFAAAHIDLEKTAQPTGATSKRPPTVEGLLRDNLSVKEICLACGVTPKTVRAIAETLDIPIQRDRPGEVAAN